MPGVATRKAGRRAGCRFRRFGVFCALLLCFGAPASAQVFEVRGGSSSLLDTHGGTLVMYGPNYTSRFSLGYTDRLRYGFLLSTIIRGYTFGAGDQSIAFDLPTDVFTGSYSFFGRGLSASRKNDRSQLFVFLGATSEAFSVPYANFGRSDTGTGLFFYQRRMSPAWKFFSHNIISSKQTSIQSLLWEGRENFRVGFSGGLGSNQPYVSSSLELDRDWVTVQASYSMAGKNFRRISVETPIVAETDRENVRVEFKPRFGMGFHVSRQNFLNPDPQPGSLERTTVNGYGFWVSPKGFRVHGSLYNSKNAIGDSTSMIFGGRRRIASRVEAGLEYYRSNPSGSASTQGLVATFRENITPRLSLTQVVTRSDGETSVAYGGNFISNLVNVGVEYQTVFVPFAGAGVSEFRQVLVLSVSFRLPRNTQVNVDTHVTPTGKLRYTGYFDSFAYRGLGTGPANRAHGGAFHDYVVRGRVVDDKNAPISGAAVVLGGEYVFTNSRGEFFLRVKRAREVTLEVALDQFMMPGRYEVVSAPARVRADREEQAETFTVVLRRLPSIPQEPVRPPIKPILPPDDDAIPLGTRQRIESFLSSVELLRTAAFAGYVPDDAFPLGTPERFETLRTFPFHR